MKEERIFFQSKGIRLEGLLSIQEAFPIKRGLILCHPHPQLGGDMYNPVIQIAAETAFQEGYTTLRFNFRGVGRSEGDYGEGVREQEDAESAIDYIHSIHNGPSFSILLLGYSFGAWVGIPVAVRDKRIRGIVAIAPPLEKYSFEILKGCKKKKLILAGSHDLFCPLSMLQQWFQTLEEPKTLSVIEGADHFFFYHHRSLSQPLREFFKEF
ncbi:MAG: alpha/beta hydrolase [Thermodesulfobacteriota bacterium]